MSQPYQGPYNINRQAADSGQLPSLHDVFTAAKSESVLAYLLHALRHSTKDSPTATAINILTQRKA